MIFNQFTQLSPEHISIQWLPSLFHCIMISPVSVSIDTVAVFDEVSETSSLVYHQECCVGDPEETFQQGPIHVPVVTIVD